MGFPPLSVRPSFLPSFPPHLAQDLFPGLNERPPHAEILTRAFDMQLPAIDGPGGSDPAKPSAAEEEEGEGVDARAAESDEVCGCLPARPWAVLLLWRQHRQPVGLNLCRAPPHPHTRAHLGTCAVFS